VEACSLPGLYGAFGVMLALRARERTGRGQFIDIALHDGIFRFLDEIAAVYDRTGHVRERSGTETHTATPHSHYPCADGRWVAIACTNDRMFERLTRAMGHPDLADDERFRHKRSRLKRRDEVNAIVRAWTSSHDRDTVIGRCSECEVPCGPVCSIEDIFNEEQFWVRDTLTRVADPRIGEVAVQGTVPKLSDTPGGIRHLGTTLAAHNETIYGDELGLTGEEIAALAEAGVI